MAWDYSEYARFKIGDLVRVTEKVDFVVGNVEIEPGEVGLIIAAESGEEETLTYWGIDYLVLIRGYTLLFFDSELELVEIKTELSTDKVKFIFLKN